MAMESAKEFVKKFYEDDDLIKELYKMGVLKPAGSYDKNAPEGEQQRKVVESAQKLGYDFTLDEYLAANKAYGQSIGIFKMISKIRHVGKVVKKADKESKKNNL